MEIIEKHIIGKAKDEKLCEDGLFISSDMVMVVDGVSSKSNRLLYGKTSGRYCRDLILETVQSIDLENISPMDFFERIDQCISKNMKNSFADMDALDYPRACLIIYNRFANEIWSYGDCQCMINGKLFCREQAIDNVMSSVRSFYLTKAILEGATTEELSVNDIGREKIYDLLISKSMFENKDSEWGYPVINGHGVNFNLLKTYSVKKDDEIVLASDGYPVLKPTLKESEEELEKILLDDPLCFQQFKATKGVKSGNISFDDRTYCRFIV